jgi:hypothetical protein
MGDTDLCFDMLTDALFLTDNAVSVSMYQVAGLDRLVVDT